MNKVQQPRELFAWFVNKGAILTWDELQARGWQGPGICVLCCKHSENLNHTFECSYTTQLWQHPYERVTNLHNTKIIRKVKGFWRVAKRAKGGINKKDLN